MARLVAVVCLTVAWPLIQLIVAAVRFGGLPSGGPAWFLVFAPMGFVAGCVAVWLWTRAATRRGRRFVAVGYLIASPVALLGSLLGGLVLPSVWGPLVYGAIPLVAGCVIGFFVGRPRTTRHGTPPGLS